MIGMNSHLRTAYSQTPAKTDIASCIQTCFKISRRTHCAQSSIPIKSNTTICCRCRNSINSENTCLHINGIFKSHRSCIDGQKVTLFAKRLLHGNHVAAARIINRQINTGGVNRNSTASTIRIVFSDSTLNQIITSISYRNSVSISSGNIFSNNSDRIITGSIVCLLYAPVKGTVISVSSGNRAVNIIACVVSSTRTGSLCYNNLIQLTGIVNIIIRSNCCQAGVIVLGSPFSRKTGSIFHRSIFDKAVSNAVKHNILSVNNAVLIFKIPAVGGTDFINGSGDVRTGQFSNIGDHRFAVFTSGNVTAVNHDIAVGSQVFADGFPAGRILRNCLGINDRVVQQKVSRITVAHHVDGIVFHIVAAVKILVDLIQRVLTILEDQHVSVFIKLRNDLFRILHKIAEDHKFTLLRHRFVFHGKGISKHHGIAGISFCFSISSRFVVKLCRNFFFTFGIFRHDVVKFFNFNIFHRFGKFFGKRSVFSEIISGTIFSIRRSFCRFSSGFSRSFVSVFLTLCNAFRRHNRRRRFFILRSFSAVSFRRSFRILHRSSRSRRIHDLCRSGSIKQHSFFQFLDRYTLLFQHLFRHGPPPRFFGIFYMLIFYYKQVRHYRVQFVKIR